MTDKVRIVVNDEVELTCMEVSQAIGKILAHDYSEQDDWSTEMEPYFRISGAAEGLAWLEKVSVALADIKKYGEDGNVVIIDWEVD